MGTGGGQQHLTDAQFPLQQRMTTLRELPIAGAVAGLDGFRDVAQFVAGEARLVEWNHTNLAFWGSLILSTQVAVNHI